MSNLAAYANKPPSYWGTETQTLRLRFQFPSFRNPPSFTLKFLLAHFSEARLFEIVFLDMDNYQNRVSIVFFVQGGCAADV